MSRKTLSVELSKEDAPGGRFYYANIDLPVGMKALLDDACQQARFQVDNLGYREITVTGCVDLPQLAEIRLDSPTLEELNYLAYRIGQLSNEWLCRALLKDVWTMAHSMASCLFRISST